MNNLILIFVVFIAIIFIVGIVLYQKPKTKKTGSFLIMSLIVLVLVRYCIVNYTYVGSSLIFDSMQNLFDSIKDMLDEFIEILIVLSILISPIAFFLGLMMAIFAKEKKQLAIKIVTFSIIIFIIALGTCFNTNYVRPFGGN